MLPCPPSVLCCCCLLRVICSWRIPSSPTHYLTCSPTTQSRYPLNDEARVHNERQLELYNATVKFQQTRDYDPVKGNFYNPNKEREYVEQRTEIQKNHHIESPKARLRLNDRTDGELYNIVNNSTLDEVSVVRIN